MSLNLQPSGEKTGYSHPRCYMAPTNNCSRSISREHYISKNILESFGTIRARGMPWDPEGQRLYVPNDLASNVLCGRHNTALSPLDTYAGDAFAVVQQFSQYVMAGAPGAASFGVDGDVINRWITKVLAGYCAAGLFRPPAKFAHLKPKFDWDRVIAILSGASIPENIGVTNIQLNDRWGALGVAVVADPQFVRGATLHIGKVRFHYSLQPEGGIDAPADPKLIEHRLEAKVGLGKFTVLWSFQEPEPNSKLNEERRRLPVVRDSRPNLNPDVPEIQ